jgi:hypothetical protein
VVYHAALVRLEVGVSSRGELEASGTEGIGDQDMGACCDAAKGFELGDGGGGGGGVETDTEGEVDGQFAWVGRFGADGVETRADGC